MNTLLPWKRNGAQRSALQPSTGHPLHVDWDRFFDDVWSPSHRDHPALAMDVFETDDEITVEAEVPGVDPDALDIRLAEDLLTLSGRKEPEREGMRRHYAERRFGAFEHSVRLHCPVDPESVEARHKNGVVTITLKKSEAVRPRRIPIHAA